MPTPAQMRQRSSRVLNILQSINESIGSSGVLELGEVEGHGRTPLIMLQEMSAKSASTHHKKLQQKHQAYKDSLPDDHEHKNISFNKYKLKDRQDRGEVGKGTPRKAQKEQGKKRPARKDRGAGGSGGDDQPPEEPPTGAAQAAAGGAAFKGREIRKKIKGAPIGDIPADPRRRSGRKLAGGALQSTFTKRRGEGRPEFAAGASVHDKIAALQKSHDDLKDMFHQATGGKTISRKTSPGRRGLMPKPKFGIVGGEHAPRPESRGGREKLRHGGHDWYEKQKQADLDELEKDRQQRGLGRGKRGDADYAPAALRAKVSKLKRERLKHPAFRDREHDDAKGHFIKKREDPSRPGKVSRTHDEHPKWAGHYVDDSGKTVHGSGKKSNKKFSNATTFGASDDDAMLHTDKSKTGSRGSAKDDEFVFHGDTDEDPRQKWYRVSKEGGYASAMASLGKSYHKEPGMRSKVVSKVKSTGFIDGSGHQINVKPTGAMHGERPACFKRKGGALTRLGKLLKQRDPSEFARLCKGSHDGVGGTKKGRSEYDAGFDPRHDDSSKSNRLHKAAEAGKAEKPSANIAAHAAVKAGRRTDIEKAASSIDRKAVRHMLRARN